MNDASYPHSKVRIHCRTAWLLGLLLLSSVILQPSAFSQSASPQVIPFQGRLTSQAGVAYTSGQYSIIFNLYSTAVAGTTLWTERHEKVGVTNGMVNVFLGSINAFSNMTGGADFSTVKYLGITVDVDNNPATADPEMVPRQMIIPAFWAKQADNATNATKLSGFDWSSMFVDASNNPLNNPSTGFLKGISLPTTSSSTVGVILQSGAPIIQTYGAGDFFAGANAGNFTVTGARNTGVGVLALSAVTSGTDNTAVGYHALQAARSPGGNVAVGSSALALTTTGGSDVAVGAFALSSNTTGNWNTAVGYNVMGSNTTGSYNTAAGMGALGNNSSANFNSAFGYQALGSNSTGVANVAVGYLSLANMDAALYNTAVGNLSLTHCTTGAYNIASGALSLANNTTGLLNTAAGFNALGGNTTGTNNTALGSSAGSNLTSGDNNIDIGNAGIATESGVIRIGNTSYNGTVFISGIVGSAVPGGGAVYINSNGQLGVTVSSRRFKDDIRSMDRASESLLALRPVTFRYKQEIDAKGIQQWGLIAEEVNQINPELVVRDSNGVIQSVRYEQVNAMLLNEFLKDHKRVDRIDTTQKDELRARDEKIAILEKRLAAMEAREKELDVLMRRIEKVLPAVDAPPAQ